MLSLLLIFLLPTELGKHFFLPFSFISGVRVDYLAPTVYVTDVVALLLFIINAHMLLRWISRNRLRLSLLGLFLLINILFSLVPWISLYTGLKIFELIGIYLVIKKQRLPLQKVVLVFLAGAACELFLAICQMYFGHSLQGIFYFAGERYFTLSTPGITKAVLWGREILRPYGTFSHPNSLAGFYLVVYLWILTLEKKSVSPLLKNSCLLVFALLVFLSFSKAAFGTLTILTAYYIFKDSSLACRLCRIARVTGLTMLSFVVLVSQTDTLGITKRITLAWQSLSVFLEHPLTGTGLGAYVTAASRLPPLSLDTLNQPVHSIYLLLLSETGIAGSIPLFLIWPFLKRMIKIAPLVILGILITGAVDHYWVTLEQNSILMVVVAGLL